MIDTFFCRFEEAKIVVIESQPLGRLFHNVTVGKKTSGMYLLLTNGRETNRG